jgi:hypothetical protein
MRLTPVSHKRRPLNAEAKFMTDTLRLLFAEFAALVTAPLMRTRAVPFAQSASRFQKPQPPVLCRVKPDWL